MRRLARVGRLTEPGEAAAGGMETGHNRASFFVTWLGLG